MEHRGKLELTWVGKYEESVIEPRILIEDPEKSYGDPRSENMLIHGDNLIALQALQQDFAGRIQCIYIDPPYNTGSAFEYYDDCVEHSIWLSLMWKRLKLLHTLLSEEGSIWISLDDSEAHYLKVLADEIFGRRNFIADVAWEKSDSPRMDAKLFSTRYDHTLVYAKNIEKVIIRQIESTSVPAHYDKTEPDGRRYYLKPLRAMNQNDSRTARPNLYYPLTAPDGTVVYPRRPDGSDGTWRWSSQKVENSPNLIEWVKGRNGWSPYYKIYADEHTSRPPETLWHFEDAGSNRVSKAEIKALFKTEKAFETPKPEKLLKLILEIATQPGDWVLDSFLGSGTSTAVAHKMGRRYIGVEMGDHAYTLCKTRMDMVIDGEQGGVSKIVNWHGGGGYHFYELAPSLLVRNDRLPIYQINPEYTFEMMCEAICKIEGFRYKPEGLFHGYSSEKRFIHVTKEFVNAEYIRSVASSLGEDQSLLIYGMAIQSDMILPDNIEVRKIPKDLLEKCSFESEVR
jgi:adenine-specific DNA-methyltransferase